MRNPLLFEALRAYFSEACKLLLPFQQDLSPIAYQPIIHKDESGYTLSGKRPQYNWIQWINKYRKQLEKLPEFETSLSFLMSDSSIAYQLRFIQHPLDMFACSLFERQNGFQFNENTFQKLYDEAEADFYTDQLTERLLAPLNRFQMENTTLELEPGLRIIKMSALDHELHYSYQEGGGYDDTNFAIEAIAKVPKSSFFSNKDSQEATQRQESLSNIQRLQNVLRLFQSGATNFDRIWTIYPQWNQITNTATHFDNTWEPAPTWGGTYNLKTQAQAKLIELWQKYKQKQLPGDWTGGISPLERACSRFLLAYTPQRKEDRLLNLMLALEPLLLDKKDSSDYRASLRYAYLLGSTPDHREILYPIVQLAYAQKHALNYGEPTPPLHLNGKKYFLEEFNEILGDAIRSLIHLFVLSSSDHQQIIAQIDRSILRGTTF